MRYLTARCPTLSRVILVESGSRRVVEEAIPRLRRSLGQHIAFDLVTCFSGRPAALDPAASVWRTQDYIAREARTRLVRELAASGATVLAIVCSNEEIMTRWKWWLAWSLPAKILIINENADAFWLDSTNGKTIVRFLLVRCGLTGEIAGRTIGRILMLPFVFLYLLLWASIVHARRFVRVKTAHRHL